MSAKTVLFTTSGVQYVLTITTARKHTYLHIDLDAANLLSRKLDFKRKVLERVTAMLQEDENLTQHDEGYYDLDELVAAGYLTAGLAARIPTAPEYEEDDEDAEDDEDDAEDDDAEDEDDEDAEDAEDEPAPKKRGRPAKAAAAPIKRGRPAKETSTEFTADEVKMLKKLAALLK